MDVELLAVAGHSGEGFLLLGMAIDPDITLNDTTCKCILTVFDNVNFLSNTMLHAHESSSNEQYETSRRLLCLLRQ